MMTSCSAGGSLEKTWGKLRASLSVGMTTLTFGQGVPAKERGPASLRSNWRPVNHESLTNEDCPENWVATALPPTMIVPPKCPTEGDRHSHDGSRQG